MKQTSKGLLICEREDCGMWTQPRRYANGCLGLAEVPEGDCPFYKPRWELFAERDKQRTRVENDPDYRKLCEEYGIKYAKRGRKKGDGDGSGVE